MSGIYNYEVAMDAIKFHKEALVKHFRGQADLYLEQAEQATQAMRLQQNNRRFTTTWCGPAMKL